MTGEKYCRLLKNIDITMNINITQGENDFKKFKATLYFFWVFYSEKNLLCCLVTYYYMAYRYRR